MSYLFHPESYADRTANLKSVERLAVAFDEHGKPTCFISDDKWDFRYYVLGEIKTVKIDVSDITIPTREAFYTTYLASDADYRLSKVSTILNKIKNLKSVISFHPKKDASTWLGKKDLLRLLEAMKGVYAYSSVEMAINTYLQIINADNSAGEGQHTQVNAASLANKYCRVDASEKKQTLAMPISVASQIMANALRLTDDAQESITAITALIRASKKNQLLKGAEGNIAPSLLAKKHLAGTPWESHLAGNYRGQHVSMWLNRTIAAAHQLLMAFTGVRIHELQRVHCGSFRTYEESGFSYHTITAETSKLVEGDDMVDTWICSDICEKLLNLIKTLKFAAGVNSKSIMLGFPHLYQGEITTKSNRPFRLVQNLVDGVTLNADDHKEYCQLNRGRENDVSIGEVWPLKSHQWRRTFATMSLRFDLATLPALKRQFKHISLQMTEWYTNYARITRNEDTRVDAELNKLIRDVQVEMSTDVLFDAYNGDGTIAGGKGNEITTLRQNNSVPDVYRDRSAIKTMLEQGKLSLKFAGLNYCTNGYRCDQDGVVNAAFCVDCKSSIIDEAIAKKWKRLHERCVGHLEFAYDCGDVSPVSYAHFTSQIRAAEHVMDQFGMQYEKFQELL